MSTTRIHSEKLEFDYRSSRIGDGEPREELDFFGKLRDAQVEAHEPEKGSSRSLLARERRNIVAQELQKVNTTPNQS